MRARDTRFGLKQEAVTMLTYSRHPEVLGRRPSLEG